MRKFVILTIMCLLPMMTMAQWGKISSPRVQEKTIKTPLNGIKIRTTDAFMQAIGSDRTLIIAANTTLTFQDGITLEGIHDLKIIGEDNAKIQIKSREDVVLKLSECRNITLRNISFGHEQGIDIECDIEANVINIDDCEQIYIDRCDLWGCGWNGLVVVRSHNLTCTNSIIRDCSNKFLHINGGSMIKFFRCDFVRNGMRGERNSYISDVNYLVFENCRFAENNPREVLFNLVTNNNGVLRNCEIHHAGSFWIDEDTTLSDEKCKWYHDYKSLSPR